MKVDNLLDELLNISPGDGFSYLQSLDVKKAKEGYIGIAKDAGALTKSSLDGAKNAQRLKHLGDMGKNVEMLKKAKDADLKDAIDKAEGALSFPAEDIPSSIETYSNSLNVFFELEWKSADADKKIIDSIPNLQEKLDPLGIILSGAPNFETKLKSIWSFINQSQNFNIVEHLGEVVEPYVNSFSEIKKLTGDFKNMKNEFLATIPLFKQSSLLNSIEESISKSLKIVLIASSNSTSSHSLTSGFLNRIKDVQAVKDDLKSDWFVEKIAVNDQKSLDILKEYLSAFDRMSSQIVEIGATFTSLQPSAKSINSVNTSTILFSSQKDVSPVELEKLQKSVSEVGGCIDKLLETTMKVNFDEFRDTIRNLKQLDVAANQTKSLIKKIADLNVYGDGKVFKSLLADIKKINATASIAITKGQIDAMRANETTLECLKDKKFDSSLASDLMKFGSNIRAFGVHAKNDKATISFLDQISKLQNLYFSVQLIQRNFLIFWHHKTLEKD